MDRYTYRAKRLDNGEWIYGVPHRIGTSMFIVGDIVDYDEDYVNFEYWWKVDSNTVGRCTGLKDKNGRLIFEGDIVKMHQFLFDGAEIENELIGEVSYSEELCAYCLSNIKSNDLKRYMGYSANEDVGLTPMFNFYGLHDESWEVIGNVHDNPIGGKE